MSKLSIKKITVDTAKCNTDSRRPSVFERLGTKPVSTSNTTSTQNTSEYCRNWALNGSCSYGKTCKYANTHTLISPSKRAKKDTSNVNALTSKEDPYKRVTSKIVKKPSHSPDLNLEEWNQTDLEYEDEKVLERRRQLLQRELELQMKKDKEVHGKDKTKSKKKAMSSSSSSRSSSTSSSSSSSSTDDSSSSSTSDNRKKVKKIKSKRHHSASSEYEDDKDRKKKLKLKRLNTKSDKLPAKKKRRIESPMKRDTVTKIAKKSVSVTRKHNVVARTKSPVSSVGHVGKVKERNRSESPKPRARDCERERHHRKGRDSEESSSKDVMIKSKNIDKSKDLDKSKRVLEEKMKLDDKSKMRTKEKERRSRTPPLERPKHQPIKEVTMKVRRSRTPEKPRKREITPVRHTEKLFSNKSSRELDKKDREMHKTDRSKDRGDDGRKGELKSRIAQEEKKTLNRDAEEKSHLSDRNIPRNRERRDKDINTKDDRHAPRLARVDLRDKERDDIDRVRDRQREREREKDCKPRERELPVASVMLNTGMSDKTSRYAREKERVKEPMIKELDKNPRDRRSGAGDRNERDLRGSDVKLQERDNKPQRFESKYERNIEKSPIKNVERDRIDRFPRERSLERSEKSVTREHLPDREAIYERNRHRRVNPRYEKAHSSIEHDRKDIPTGKLDRLPERRESPRRSMEVERSFDRGYSRVPSDHWEASEESSGRVEYHPHEEERRKPPPIEPRKFNSPFNERRPREDRSSSRYVVAERTFDEHHQIYPGDKIRPPIRDESSNDNWDLHHDVDHGSRDRVYPSEWEEREWPRSRPMWDRDSLPRSEAHDEEWPQQQRYDSPMSDWKLTQDTRKWENPALHVARANYRNERLKDLEINEGIHAKPPRRPPYSTPDMRDECGSHGSKQSSLHGSMKEEPINKKLMELAEGRPRRSREKSADSFQKKFNMTVKEKIIEVVKEPVIEIKRPCLEESLTRHTESDLSDISDDPDDILNMEDEETVEKKKPVEIDKENSKPVVEETVEKEPEKVPEEPQVFRKEKEDDVIDDDNMETMDFEEISDGELEEDIKTSGKGLGDALGVDWESLVKESQPRRPVATNQDLASNRWQCKAIFQRIGISVKYAGSDFIDKMQKKYQVDGDDQLLLHNVALMHTALYRDKMNLNNSTLCNVITSDDSLYRVNRLDKFNDNSNDNDDDDDDEIFKPFTSLYDDAKLLLQQT